MEEMTTTHLNLPLFAMSAWIVGKTGTKLKAYINVPKAAKKPYIVGEG